MRNSRRAALALTILLAVSACSTNTKEGIYNTAYICIDDNTPYFENVDWNKAKVVEITYRNNGYKPLVSDLKVNKPYILRVNNKDDKINGFSSGELFSSSALDGIVNGDVQSKASCPGTINIGPGKRAEVRLMPLKEGTYHFSNDPIVWEGVLPDSLHPSHLNPIDNPFFINDDKAVGAGEPQRAIGIITVE